MANIITRRLFMSSLAGLAVLPVLGPCELLAERPRKYVQGWASQDAMMTFELAPGDFWRVVDADTGDIIGSGVADGSGVVHARVPVEVGRSVNILARGRGDLSSDAVRRSVEIDGVVAAS